ITRVLKHLPVPRWPEADRLAFDRAFRQPADPFDEEIGAGAHLAPATVRANCFAYRRWLGWLSQYHPSSLALAPADRVSRESVRSYAAVLGMTMRSVALADQVARLYHAMRCMYPERDWAWLGAIKQRLEANAQPAARPALPFDSMALQDLGFQLMAEAEVRLLTLNVHDKRATRAIAELHRDGVLIALAALFPLRRKNLSALTIGNSLYRVDQLWTVKIPESESKNGRVIDAVLPP